MLPSGTYAPLAGEESLRRLRDWTRRGGTLVTIAEASRWAASERVNLLETRTELRGGRPETEERPSTSRIELVFGIFRQAVRPAAGRREPGATPPRSTTTSRSSRSASGPRTRLAAILRVTTDQEHWLSAGQDGELQVLLEGQRVFTPIRLDRGRNVGVYAAKDKLVASGLVWDEARDQLAQKAYLIHQPLGQGHVIAFAEDPNFRAFTEASSCSSSTPCSSGHRDEQDAPRGLQRRRHRHPDHDHGPGAAGPARRPISPRFARWCRSS